jgi:hypothetical protein
MLSDDSTFLLIVLFAWSFTLLLLNTQAWTHNELSRDLARIERLHRNFPLPLVRRVRYAASVAAQPGTSQKGIQWRTMRVLVVLIVGLALTGCSLYDPPEKPTKLASEMSPQQWCGEALMLF